ncbi:hypothetical protein D3C76_1284000 [compost metagenome]
MWAIDHADVSHGRQVQDAFGRQLFASAGVKQRAQVQYVAGAQGTATMAAELAEGEGTFAAQVIGHLQPSAHAQVAACAAAGNCAQAQGRACRDEQRGVHGLRLAVEAERDVGTGDGDHGVAVEAQHRAAHGDFQGGAAFGVAEQAVALAQGATVHRA